LARNAQILLDSAALGLRNQLVASFFLYRLVTVIMLEDVRPESGQLFSLAVITDIALFVS
jgi:hypothetical protein